MKCDWTNWDDLFDAWLVRRGPLPNSGLGWFSLVVRVHRPTHSTLHAAVRKFPSAKDREESCKTVGAGVSE